MTMTTLAAQIGVALASARRFMAASCIIQQAHFCNSLQNFIIGVERRFNPKLASGAKWAGSGFCRG